MKKKYGKIAVIAGLMMLVTTILMPTITADGWHPSQEYLHLHEPNQKAVIYWDGTTETLILSSAAKAENLTNIAWVVPIISTTMPNVTAGNMTVFEELVDYFKNNEYFHYKGLNIANVGNDNVTVLESKEIDIYDVIILKATNASDLIDWLIDNNFQVPEEAYAVLERYVNMQNCYFVVNKIDLKNKCQEVQEQIDSGRIEINLSQYAQEQNVFNYESSFEQFIKVHSFQILCNQKFFENEIGWNLKYNTEFLMKFGINQSKYDELIRKYSVNDKQFLNSLSEYGDHYSNIKYHILYTEIDELIQTYWIRERYDAIVNEISKILEPIKEYYNIVHDLREGMATPLKFEFTPPEPYYPLTISSLNAGDGVIEVYVIGEKPVIDANNVMIVEACRDVNSSLKETLENYFSTEKAEYVTRLSYHGELKNLTDDAVFEFCPVFKSDESNYIVITTSLFPVEGTVTLPIITWNSNEEILEVQYRIDIQGPWILAKGVSSHQLIDIFFSKSHYYQDFYSIYEPSWLFEKTNWLLQVNTSTLNNGEHTLQIRTLKKGETYIHYSTSIYADFFVLNDNSTYQNTNQATPNSDTSLIEQNIGQNIIPLIGVLVGLSIFTIVVLKRNSIHKS